MKSEIEICNRNMKMTDERCKIWNTELQLELMAHFFRRKLHCAEDKTTIDISLAKFYYLFH